MNRQLLILDVRGVLMRRYYGAHRETVSGENGAAIPAWQPGLTDFVERDLADLVTIYPARNIIAVWDAGNTYRRTLYGQYKEKRRAREKDKVGEGQLRELFQNSQTLLAYLGIKNVSVKGQEADDVIALLCHKLNANIVVRTGDADLFQLVSPNVSVMMSDDLYQVGGTYKGIPITLIRVWKSLVGDSSDGYLGIPQFGDAKFQALLKDYGEDGLLQLEECVRTGNYDALNAAFNATQDENLAPLIEHRANWALSYQLASLHPDICYSASPTEGVVKPLWHTRLPTRHRVEQILFQSRCPDLIAHFEHLFPQEELLTLKDHERLQQVVAEAVRTSEEIPFDFESYDTLKHTPFQEAAKSGKAGVYVDVLSQSITGISFNYGKDRERTCYVSFNHDDTDNFPKEWAAWLLKSLSQKPLIAQNAMFEHTVSAIDLGLELPAAYDTAIMSSYVDEELPAGLKQMSKNWFHYDQTAYKDVVGDKDMSQISAPEVLSYGCDDSLVTGHLFDLFRLIMQVEGSWDFYRKYEIEHLVDDSQNFVDGFKISVDEIRSLHREDNGLIAENTTEIRNLLSANAITKTQEQLWQDATRLLNMTWETEAFKYTDADQAMIDAAYQDLFTKSWYQCLYEPYTEETSYEQFKPTPKKLTEVLAFLGSSLILDKNSKRGVNEWLQKNEETLEADPKLTQFAKLLAAASDRLSKPDKRNGPEYEALASFCQELINQNESGKVSGHGTALNFGSSPQMQSLFYGIMSLPVRRRSKVDRGSFRDKNGLKGSPSTNNKAVAAALVYDVAETGDWRRDVLNRLLTIKRARQNISLYHKPYPLWVHPRDGLIHPQIKNCGTKTRRPAGTSPNVLQVSKKDDARIRKVYLPWKEEYVWVCLDFNGQEMRIAASESEDRALLDAYIGPSKKDTHCLTASSFANYLLPREGLPAVPDMSYESFLTGRSNEQTRPVYNKIRDIAKAVNFLIIYVGGPTTLAENLIIPVELAKQLMQGTFRLYSGLQPWQSRVIQFARAKGYVETAYGNRRHLTREIGSDDDFLRTRQERQAVNYTIQGCAADILKIVQTEMRTRELRKKYHLASVMPIYDEIAACCPRAAAADYIQEMRGIMEVTPPGHQVPMEVEAGIGFESWGDKVELKDCSHPAVTEFLLKHKEGAA